VPSFHAFLHAPFWSVRTRITSGSVQGDLSSDPNAFGRFSILPSYANVRGQERAHSFKLYLVLGAFVLDVTFTPLANDPYKPMHGRPSQSGYYEKLWPASVDLAWPPPLSLDSDSYEEFSRQDLYPPICREN
jgi:hypothetical protein